MYEAWDIDAHIGRTVTDVTAADDVRLVRDDGASAVLEVTRRFRASTVRQRIEMSAGSRAVDLRFDVDWHEQRTLLKLAFPVDVLADRAASEIQFGHVFRPTHANTSWDMARYETCAHRWVHVGEPGFGVAVANDSTYGHDIRRDAHEAGTGTTIRLSLVRGPRFPDPDTDQGRHHLAVTLVVGTDIDGAIAHGQRLNQPLRTRTGSGPVPPLLEVAGDGVLIETVKPAEDGSGDVVVRLYEALGRRAGARVRPAFRYGAVVETDLLERPVAPRALSDDGDGGGDGGGDGFALRLRPFQIVTLRFTGVAAA
jgi:alpha-mannosidase